MVVWGLGGCLRVGFACAAAWVGLRLDRLAAAGKEGGGSLGCDVTLGAAARLPTAIELCRDAAVERRAA